MQYVGDVLCFFTTRIANYSANSNFDWPFGKNLQHKLWPMGYYLAVSPVAQNNVYTKYWPMSYYSEENCQTIAHGPLLDWAFSRKAPVTFPGPVCNFLLSHPITHFSLRVTVADQSP